MMILFPRRRSPRRTLRTPLLACATLLAALGASPALAQNPPAAPKPDSPVLPPVDVSAKADGEERLVGPYRQPEWTTERRFPTTRVYVLPEGMVEFEQWWRGTYNRDRTEAHRLLSEIAVGLPHRFQVDIYGRFEGGTGSSMRYVGEQFETRYAFADWGKIPGNPTAYLEFAHNRNGAHLLEGKLLLGDQLRSGLYWAVNLSYEEELGGAREIERALTFALSKRVRDSKLSVGVEGVLEHVTGHGSGSKTGFLLGPSLQWRPTRTVHVDVVPLFGLTHDAPRSQIFVVFGINLRQGGKAQTVSAPISSQPR